MRQVAAASPGFLAAFGGELLKARRSRVPLITALGFSLAPVMSALFMIILKDPVLAERMGVITAKAQILGGTASWEAYLSVVSQAIAIGGLLLFSLVTAWVFGRELSDGTAQLWLAVRTPRWAVVAAKLAVVAVICVTLVAWVWLLALVVGGLVGLPGGGTAVIGAAGSTVIRVAALTVLLMTPVAFVAGWGRGYLAPMGFALLTLFLAQVVAATGHGGLFPWSVPALLSGAAGPPDELVGAAGVAIVVATSAIAGGATFLWWYRADFA